MKKSLTMLLMVPLLISCELLKDNEQREIITTIQFEAPECKLYLKKSLEIDASLFEGSAIELDNAFKIKGTEGVLSRPGE